MNNPIQRTGKSPRNACLWTTGRFCPTCQVQQELYRRTEVKSHCTNGAGAVLMPPESPRTGLSPEAWRAGAGGYRGPQAAPAGAAPACSRQAGQFEQQCKTRGIRLFALPPRSPKLNGSVERAQSITRLFVYRRQRAIHLIFLAPPPTRPAGE